MIIRHGFMKDSYGTWHNMGHISDLKVVEMGQGEFRIVAVTKIGDDYIEEFMTEAYRSEEEAQSVLDNVMMEYEIIKLRW